MDVAAEIRLFEPGPVTLPASSHHTIGLHLSGPVQAVCRIDGRTYRRVQSAGEMDLIPAGMTGTWCDDEPATVLVIRVADRLLRGLGPERNWRVHTQVRDAQFTHLAHALEQSQRNASAATSLYQQCLSQALALRLLNLYGGAAPQGRLGRWRRSQLEDWIEEHLHTRVTLEQLAAVAGYSASHLGVLFRRDYGVSLYRYLVRRRVERARELLAGRPDLSLTEVALACGFAHQSHLSLWMRRILGQTPGQLRQNLL